MRGTTKPSCGELGTGLHWEFPVNKNFVAVSREPRLKQAPFQPLRTLAEGLNPPSPKKKIIYERRRIKSEATCVGSRPHLISPLPSQLLNLISLPFLPFPLYDTGKFHCLIECLLTTSTAGRRKKLAARETYSQTWFGVPESTKKVRNQGNLKFMSTSSCPTRRRKLRVWGLKLQ